MNGFQRKMKQFVILAILFLFFGLIAVVLMWPEQDPCANGAKDAGEVGVDCGGFCAKACPLPERPDGVKEVEVNWSTFVQDGANAYDFVASLSNDNESWGVASVDYAFTYFDAAGNELGRKIGKASLMPKGSTGNSSQQYVIEQNVISNVAPAKVDFKLSHFIWQEVEGAVDVANLNEGVIAINGKDFSVERVNKYYMASGVTQNKSKYDFVYVNIAVVVYGEDNKVLSARKTNQKTMAAGDGWAFFVPFPNLKVAESDIAWVDYRATTDVFDQNNFMKEYRSAQ